MISLNEFLVKKHVKHAEYKYHPTTKDELIDVCVKLIQKGKTNLNCIDTSKITDMSHLFDSSSYHSYGVGLSVNVKDIDISQWDVSNVIDMSYMFRGCTHFNSDLSKWDVSKVKYMAGVFDCCHQFNSDLSQWNVNNVITMGYMFQWCHQFNSDLSKWNVSKVENMKSMFDGCEQFNSDLSNWDVSKVEYMNDMFNRCKSLKTIPSWYKE